MQLAIVLDSTYQGQFELPEGGLHQESDRGRQDCQESASSTEKQYK